MADPISVELSVDPACPWAWLTSRWLLEVEKVRPVSSRLRLFDLAEINRERDEGALRDSHSAGERALRTLVLARHEGGDAAVWRLYSELGEAWHERGEPLGELETLERAAVAAGLPSGHASRALDDPSTLDGLLAEHAEQVRERSFGVPTLWLQGCAPWFGPIINGRVGGAIPLELEEVGDGAEPPDHVPERARLLAADADVGRKRLRAAARAGAAQDGGGTANPGPGSSG